MRQLLALALSLMCGVAIGVVVGFNFQNYFSQKSSFFSPLVKEEKVKQYPLNQYTIENLTQRSYQPSQIIVEKAIERSDQTNQYRELEFSFTTMGKKMTGQLTLPPASAPTPTKAIMMIRGWVPQETYQTGLGTRPVARVFAQNGYAVFAPDFFGYGQSDKEPINTWEARFIKPINVIELLKSIQTYGVKDHRQSISALQTVEIKPINQSSIGIWAHSNGGQIALTSLEILSQPIPTTLWAPVTAPFPYSVLFFSDELKDEGKQQRAWIASFEKDYDVFEFSLTQHLDLLTGPLQIQHGTNDDAALISWSDEFIEKIKNNDKISYQYFKYPGADHNLRPITAWNKAVKRDLAFFAEHLK